MSLESDTRAIVARLRGWGFSVREEASCYSRSNGLSWANGRGPDGHVNHHYVCSMNPSQTYIDGLVSNLKNGNTVNWFADVNGRAYMIGAGPMNHAGTGNSSVLARVKKDQPPPGPASAAGDMKGNNHLGGTEGQHPGDDTPWPQPLLDVMFAINAAEFLQYGFSENRAIHHYEWTNRKIDMSWLGGPKSRDGGLQLRANVKKRMEGGKPTPPTPKPPGDDDLPLNAEDKKWIKDTIKEQFEFWLPRALNVYMDGKGNAAFPAGSTTALDGMGIIGRLQRGVDASRTGKANSAFPNPATPKD